MSKGERVEGKKGGREENVANKNIEHFPASLTITITTAIIITHEDVDS